MDLGGLHVLAVLAACPLVFDVRITRCADTSAGGAAAATRLVGALVGLEALKARFFEG